MIMSLFTLTPKELRTNVMDLLQQTTESFDVVSLLFSSLSLLTRSVICYLITCTRCTFMSHCKSLSEQSRV